MPDLGWSEYIAGVEDAAYVDAVIECQWFVDEVGDLLIPDPWGDDYAVDTGINPKVVEKLNAWYREHYDPSAERLPEVPVSVYRPLGLTTVVHGLKRHNEIDGFYYA